MRVIGMRFYNPVNNCKIRKSRSFTNSDCVSNILMYFSVGQSLALPGSMIADFILHHFLLPWPALIGAGCVFVGFCGFVYEEMKHEQ